MTAQDRATGGRALDPSSLPDDAEIELEDPEKGYKFTQVRDWISLDQQLDHTAFRVYTILLGIATKQSQFKKRLTKDAVRWCMPGVNGKTMSKRTFENALKSLQSLELVTLTDKRSEQVRAADGTFGRDESFRFSLRLWPPDSESFGGYRSIMDKLADYPGPGWDTSQQKPSSRRAQNSANGGGDSEPAPVDNSRTQNSAHGSTEGSPQNSAQSTQNSAPDTGGDLHEQGSPTQPFQTVVPSPPPPAGDAHADDVGTSRTGEGREKAQEEKQEDPATGGRRLNEITRQRAIRFLSEEILPSVSAELVNAMTAEEKRRVVALLVDARERGVGNAEVRESLTNVYGTLRLGSAWQAKLTKLIDKATAEAETVQRHRLPACDSCRARYGEPKSFRTVLVDPHDAANSDETPCPACHPDAPGVDPHGLAPPQSA